LEISHKKLTFRHTTGAYLTHLGLRRLKKGRGPAWPWLLAFAATGEGPAASSSTAQQHSSRKQQPAAAAGL
jgi:hypothetical protein